MGSSLSAEEEPGQKEELQASAAPASADCAQPPCPGGDGKASSDVVSVPVESSESKAAAQPGLSATETPSDTPVPPEPEEEAAPDSQVAPDRFEHNLGTSSPALQLQSPPRAQRELSPESEALDLDATQVPGQLHSEAKAPRTLEQQMSLKPSDDERTEISKKISWILRHGAKKVNVNIDDAGWVNVNDLLTSDILGGTTEDKLLAMISESNAQKTRYEMEDDPKGGKRIRAISKSRRNAFARELREKEKKEREKKREEEAREQQRERETLRRDPERPEQRDERSERSERSERWDGREAREAREPRREDGRWWGETWQEGPTYEQQVREGFLPVWQGSRLVAMAKEHQTVRPGRRANAYGGKGFEGKGEHAKCDKGDGKGYDFKNEAKGERKGRGKDEKGKEGKGKFEGKGFHMDSRGKGDGFKPEGFRHEGKEEEQHEVKADRYGRGSRQQRWRAVNDRDIIVRVGLGMETDIVGTLLAGSLVTQVGEDKIVKNGIARMFIESIEPNAGIKGWVTRSAEAAGGPVFFKPDRGNVRGEPRGKEGKVGKGSQFGGEKGEKGKTDSKGKGRRPVGEGETAGGRLDQPDDQQPPPVVASAESS